MDSGNSGSMQSSSGGDEEYDSRPESVSAFLNSSGHVLVSSMTNTRQPPAPPASHPQSGTSTSFDPLMSNYMEYSSLRSPHQSPSTVNSLLNLDMAWARGLRSDPNCTDIGGVVLMGSSSSASAAPSSHRGAYHGGVGVGGGGIMSPASQSPGVVSERPPPPPGSSSGGEAPQAARNSKKRSRASRRAPTTVLTTDTSNFRAMVQEFTGIPAPPFSPASFPRTRFDLFGSSALRSDPGPPPYLLRPFAHKVVQPPSSSSSSSPAAAMLDVLSSNATATAAANIIINGNAATCSNNLQHQNLLNNNNNNNNNNPMFTFQSLLQQSTPPPPKYPSLPVFNSKQQHSTIPDLTDFSATVGNNNATSSLSGLMAAASDGLATRTEHPPNWVDGDHHDQAHHHHHHHPLRSFGGGGGHYDDAAASQRVGNCKLNYAGSTSTDFHAEKGSENNVTSRGEGMVDSWICSSD